MAERYALRTMSCACALGATRDEAAAGLRARTSAGLKPYASDIPNRTVLFGEVPGELPAIADPIYDSRTDRLLVQVLNAERAAFEGLVGKYGPDRVAVVLGTSNTGMDEAQRHVDTWIDAGAKPEAMRLSQIELGTPAEFLARELGVTGPAYAISTACSSSAKAFPAARRLIEAGVVDAPIAKADGATVRRCVRPESEGGRPSTTEYRVLARRQDRTLVRLRLLTGRTHQIRVHMAHLGCPVFGDFLYGQEDAHLPGRFALHSAHLRLTHPMTGQELDFEQPLPEELARLMRE